MKELPATLLLRPFNFDIRLQPTSILSQRWSNSRKRHSGALAIVVSGLLPVLLLHKAVAGGRAGGRAFSGSAQESGEQQSN